MKKKIGKLVVAISIIALAVSGVVQAQPITVPNFSFELDESSAQITELTYDITNEAFGWYELAGADPLNARPHIAFDDVSINVPDGDCYLMLKLESYNESSITWQILAGETMSEGDTYLLTFNTTIHQAAAVGNVVATLIYDDEGTLTEIYGETFVPATADDADEPWDEVSLYFTVPAGAPYIGKDIGIKFEQTARNWVAVDNVRLELNPDINFPPEVDAGSTQAIALSESDTVQLAADVLDDGSPDPPGVLTYTWTGPAGVSFSPSPNVEDPCAIFTAVGVYELQLSVSDSEADACDVVTILVRANDDPVAHWNFETGTGTNVVDRTVNNNFGTFAGDPEPNWVAGWIGDWALDVENGSYVAITTDPVADPNLNTMYGAVTVSAWVKVDEWGAENYDGIVTKGSGSDGEEAGWLLMRNSSNDSLAFSTPGVGIVRGSVNVKDGHWHHVVGVHDGVTISLYVDGNLDTSVAATGLVKPKVAEVWIGGNSESVADLFLDGEIDDVRIYSYGMDIDGVQALAAMGALIPVVDAGEDQVFSMQGGFLQLDGTVTDDGKPEAATLAWTQESGTGTAEFSNDAIEDPTVTFTEAGEYVLRLTADDIISQIYDEVTITVENPTCQDVIDDGLLLPADLSGPEGVPDCYVDLYDFAAFAGNWLQCNNPQDSECEFPY